MDFLIFLTMEMNETDTAGMTAAYSGGRIDWLRRSVSERVATVAILSNSLVVFLMLFPSLPEKAVEILWFLDGIFNIYFIYEALVKICLYRKAYFRKLGNLFDFSLVVLVIVATCEGMYESASGLYVLRIVRLMKMVSAFSRMDEFQRLFGKITVAFRASMGIIMMMGALVFMLAVVMTIFYAHEDPDHFGNPLLSIYTVLRLVTLEGWYEIPDTLASNEDVTRAFVSRLVFTAIVIFGGIFGISFITSTVTDKLAEDDNQKILDKLDALERQLAGLKNTSTTSDRNAACADSSSAAEGSGGSTGG